jgi:hypothetical protein
MGVGEIKREQIFGLLFGLKTVYSVVGLQKYSAPACASAVLKGAKNG